MSRNVLFFAWNRSIAGREKLSAAHFQEFLQYLAARKQAGAIDSFEPVFLDTHGGDLNGFVLVRGEPGKLDALVASDDWQTHVTRAAHHLEGSGSVRGVAGDAVSERMALWTKHIPAT